MIETHMIDNFKLEEICPSKKSGKGITKKEVNRVEKLYKKLSRYFYNELRGFKLKTKNPLLPQSKLPQSKLILKLLLQITFVGRCFFLHPYSGLILTP